jgi:glycosyltransferase involved in cell wall biosynthesis
MNSPRIAIFTPTYNTKLPIVDRCIRSVQWQTYKKDCIDHFICHDGPDTRALNEFSDYLKNNHWHNIYYSQLSHNTKTYGASVRQHLLNTVASGYDYILHLDDDNLIFPEFLEAHVNALEENPDCGFSVCKIIHLGPLPSHLAPAPAIINGIPPVYRNIDTLQIVVRSKAMKECGWIEKTGIDGYCNDGYTYDKLGKMFKWIEVPKLLGVHI